ncbi:MAG: class I SAM-dependent methyltransferase [Acidobacteriota bacterium]
MVSLSLCRLLAFRGRNRSARRRWEYIGWDRADAYRMMDGSGSESELRRRGADMAGRLVAALAIGVEHTVLEVGCGVARVGRELAPSCRSYHGVDLSRSLLAHARRRTAHLRQVTFSHLAGEGLDGLTTTFDRVVCHLVLLHVQKEDVQRLLSGFARVLAPAGAVYFDLWNIEHADACALWRAERDDPRVRRQPNRSRFYTVGEVTRWMEAAGLTAVWLGHDSFLIQAVAMRADAEPTARCALSTTLAQKAHRLVPRGHLEF